MSGDSHNNDDADFLDEDFVVEDLTGKNEDLEDLFDKPAPQADADAAEDADPDSDDMLFTDHTEGLEPSEQFQGREQFAEDSEAQWESGELDLEDEVEPEQIGVPDATLESEVAAADPMLDDAKESFTQELDSMLRAEEEFAIDGEAELELVEAGDSDGPSLAEEIDEFEQSGPFVLDDGDGLWADDDALHEGSTAEAEHEAEQVEEQVLEPLGSGEPELVAADEHLAGESDADVEAMPLLEAASVGDEPSEQDAGWEPLPSTSVDALSEVDGVERTDDGYEDGYEDDYAGSEAAEFEQADPVAAAAEVAPTFAPPPPPKPQDLEDVDGHDIYAEDEEDDEAVVVGGPGSHRGRAWGALLSLAAAMLLICGAAVVVARPQWVGLRIEPTRVERVEVARPQIALAIDEPANPLIERVADNSQAATGDGQSETAPETAQPVATGEPGVAEPGETPPAATTPEQPETVAGGDDGGSQPSATAAQTATEVPIEAPIEAPLEAPVETANPVATGEQPTAQPVETPAETPVESPVETPAGQRKDPVAVGTETPALPEKPALPVAVAGTADDKSGWPVRRTGPQPRVPAAGQAPLTRFGDGLMVGESHPDGARAAAVDGVMPGSRAFAQLHNGNYFIGSVKQVASQVITLRVESGEVTLKKADIAQLTQLGSADYEELQKATRGFVRLTNNNRLVGGILSRIADDHIVLEFRSNRVMLPRSVVGEIVSGNGDQAVRLGTTTEEDDWVRKLAERQLGTGKGNEVPQEPQQAGPRGGPPR